MPYSTRNSFYLRISKQVVLPVYVYLDDRHVEWMSDQILQHVLSDLRPHILPKLRDEVDNLTGSASGQKKASVETHRGYNYQFCYFIRKTEPHSVAVKSRTYRATSKRGFPEAQTTSAKKRGKRKEALSPTLQRKKKRRVDPLAGAGEDDGPDLVQIDDQHESTALNENDPGSEFSMDLEIDEEEEKPKPILGLRYQGFSIYGHCLCVVVEPWPSVRYVTQPTLFAGRPKVAARVPSPEAGGQAEAALPLFLPEEPEGQVTSRKETQVNKSYLNQILNEEPASDMEDDMDGMLSFSQVLQNVGDARMGGTNDDDDEDAFMLFGETDDFREI